MPEFGITSISIVPCRRDPSDASEQVTQLLFGEYYEIKETRKKWVRIKVAADGYDCWIDVKQHTPIDPKYAERLAKQKFNAVSLDMAGVVQSTTSETLIPILMGSSLPFFEDGKFKLGKEEFMYDGQVQMKAERKNGSLLVQNAFSYLHAPYLWGGRSPFGIDCSGLTQVCYKMIGIALPRDAWQQQLVGNPLSFIEESKPGDLAFFDNEEGKIVHVGLMLDNNRILHASGRVRVDRLDHQGIYNNDTKAYSHRLRIIKRIMD